MKTFAFILSRGGIRQKKYIELDRDMICDGCWDRRENRSYGNRVQDLSRLSRQARLEKTDRRNTKAPCRPQHPNLSSRRCLMNHTRVTPSKMSSRPSKRSAGQPPKPMAGASRRHWAGVVGSPQRIFLGTGFHATILYRNTRSRYWLPRYNPGWLKVGCSHGHFSAPSFAG